MKEFSRSIPAESFFLQTDSGKRFCLYHAPSTDTKCRGVIIYVHPFGEEMNKSRRMAALQARAFAAIGFGVLQIDLFGCGDSSGDFADARWHTWKCDLAVARTWVEIHVAAPVSLWGLRLGALLALDFARSSEGVFDQIILWQPVISGESFLTQFLRLQLANEMLAKGHEKTGGTIALRNLLRAGKSLEVAGYELAPSLATAIDSLKIAELTVASSPIHWFEIVAEQGRTITPSGAKIVTAWKENAIDLHLHLISCPPFWGTQEISECPQLLSATTNALAAAHHEL
jgi:exosortase A-associated hydrolase 2